MPGRPLSEIRRLNNQQTADGTDGTENVETDDTEDCPNAAENICISDVQDLI